MRVEAEGLADHWDAMVGTARGVLGTVDDAEECASEALLQVCEARPGDVLNMEAYLVTVAKRRAIDRLRHLDRARRRDARLAAREPLLVPDAAEDVARRDEARWMSMEAERLLDPRALELLRRVADGDDIHDISQALGMSTSAAQSALHRSRKLLREVYAKALALIGIGALAGRRVGSLSAPAIVAAALVLVPSPPDAPARTPHDATPRLQAEQAQESAESAPRPHGARKQPISESVGQAAVPAAAAPPAPPVMAGTPPAVEIAGPLSSRVAVEERNDNSPDQDGLPEAVAHCLQSLQVTTQHVGC